jgi:hypothetical protein
VSRSGYNWYLEAIVERIEKRLEAIESLKGRLDENQQVQITEVGNTFCVQLDGILREQHD